MCGIAGIVNRNSQSDCDPVKAMVHSLRHRGPDGHSVLEVEAGGTRSILGHTRLAVIDPDPRSNQPFEVRHHNKSGYLTYNGMIYNYLDLRSELEALGHKFLTTSDTEVVCRSLLEWGERALARLEGMFALAFIHGESGEVILSRDSMGMKPLYYCENGPETWFASESHVLQNQLNKSVDNMSLGSYLTQGAIFSHHSLFEGIQQIPPGHFLIQKGETRTLQEFRSFLTPDSSSPIQTVLEGVVREHLRTDVPLVVFLSSGIDSTLIAQLATRHTSSLKTLTIGFDDAKLDESQTAAQIAQHLGTDHATHTLTGSQILGDFAEVVDAMDGPTVDGFNQFFVSRETRARGFKVALSGLGGDELFAGYRSFQDVPRFVRLRKHLSFLQSFANPLISLAELVGHRGLYKAALGLQTQPTFQDALLLRRFLTHDSVVKELLPRHDSHWSDRVWSDMSLESLDAINKVSVLESSGYMRHMLMRDADQMSMHHGLELRTPLTDKRIFDTALSISGKEKVGPQNKPNLFNLLDPKLKQLVAGPKRGFTFPWKLWLETTLKDFTHTRICESRFLPSLGFRKDGLEQFLSSYYKGNPKATALSVISLVVLAEYGERKHLI